MELHNQIRMAALNAAQAFKAYNEAEGKKCMVSETEGMVSISMEDENSFVMCYADGFTTNNNWLGVMMETYLHCICGVEFELVFSDGSAHTYKLED